jgi:cathepsin D
VKAFFFFGLFVGAESAHTLHYQAESQTLGAANTYDGFQRDRFPPDGLMGMAFPSISVFNASSPFQTIFSQNDAISPIFGFKLASSDSDSELFLGGVNTSLYKGDFTWVNLTNEVLFS